MLGRDPKSFLIEIVVRKQVLTSDAQNWRPLTMGPLTVPLNTKEVSCLDLD